MLGRPAGLSALVGGAKGVFEEKEDTGELVAEVLEAGAATSTEAEFSFILIGKIFPTKGSFTSGAGAACLVVPAAAVPVRAWCRAALSRSRFRREEHLCWRTE